MNWPKSLINKIKTKVNLAAYTSFKIGGEAEFFFEPKNIRELKDILVLAKKEKVPVFILGAGSNILVSDSGVKGLVIKINEECFKRLHRKGNFLIASSGLKLSKLILFAKKKGLSGLEFLSGIPGTVGGSLVGNAGAWGSSIGDLVEDICVLDYNGRKKLFCGNQLKFSYRKSNLNKYIILWAKLRLKSKSKDSISSKINNYLLLRRASQGSSFPNAGCIFKNPAGKMAAGELIDLCQLKGRRKSKAIISRAHANFILNLGNAKSSDVIFLMNLIRKKVKAKFKINLEPEIKLWR